MRKKIFLIRWCLDDSVWKAYSNEEDARAFVDYVHNHTTSDRPLVWIDSIFLDLD